ncbi:MAG TPA: hypothetical protein VH599_14415 [Ktedonobacterales bacterium]
MVLVAPPSRRPTLRQGERSPTRPTDRQASVEPPRWRRYKWQPPIGGGTLSVIRLDDGGIRLYNGQWKRHAGGVERAYPTLKEGSFFGRSFTRYCCAGGRGSC